LRRMRSRPPPGECWLDSVQHHSLVSGRVDIRTRVLLFSHASSNRHEMCDGLSIGVRILPPTVRLDVCVYRCTYICTKELRNPYRPALTELPNQQLPNPLTGSHRSGEARALGRGWRRGEHAVGTHRTVKALPGTSWFDVSSDQANNTGLSSPLRLESSQLLTARG
jgi:hypothetical protein